MKVVKISDENVKMETKEKEKEKADNLYKEAKELISKWFKIGSREEAKEKLNEALKIYSENGEEEGEAKAKRLMGDYNSKYGDGEDAANNYISAAELVSGKDIIFSCECYESAYNMYKKLDKKDKKVEIGLKISKIKIKRGKYDEAIKNLNDILPYYDLITTKEKCEYNIQKGIIQINKKDYKNAIISFDAVLNDNENSEKSKRDSVIYKCICYLNQNMEEKIKICELKDKLKHLSENEHADKEFLKNLILSLEMDDITHISRQILNLFNISVRLGA